LTGSNNEILRADPSVGGLPEGWDDPVTGMGSPIFDKMLAAAMKTKPYPGAPRCNLQRGAAVVRTSIDQARTF